MSIIAELVLWLLLFYLICSYLPFILVYGIYVIIGFAFLWAFTFIFCWAWFVILQLDIVEPLKSILIFILTLGGLL